MSDEETINLTLADVGDDTAFAEMYEAWETRHLIPLHDENLRTICRLWFGRGIARGTEWSNSEVDRQMAEHGSE
jgi:hypothetical protein